MRSHLLVALCLATTTLAGARPQDPLQAPWPGPYGGLPPFSSMKASAFPAAFRSSMQAYRADVRRIADNPAAATFENTIAALENAGRSFARVNSMFGVFTSTMNTPEVQAIDREWRPRLTALSDEITGNSRLYARIQRVYQDRARLTPEQSRLAWVHFNNFRRAGAALTAGQKKTLSGYNQSLARLYTKFSQNVLADEEKKWVTLDSEADLAGLPPSLRDSAAAAARDKQLEGKWVIRNTRSAMEPFLTYSTRRDLRERAFRLWTSRGDGGDAYDNNQNVTDILILRARRAKLLGFPTYAHWRVEDQMARTPERAMKLMMQVWPAAVARVHQEVADMQTVASAEGMTSKIEPWDYRFYAEKVRKQRYDLDENEIKPYMQLDKLRQGLFYVANRLYGFTFTPVTGVSTLLPAPDIRVWKVTNPQGGLVGLWYFDPYARNGKSSGAWMNEYRTQENFLRPVRPIVSNNSNFLKGAPGHPVLLSWDDAETMFHEFGHALHGLNSQVHYPTLAGTNVARDYVEFPSQLNENWLSTPEVLNRFALRTETGAPMPPELIAKIRKAATFNQGFSTTEYLASAIVDMKLHLAGEQRIDPRIFEKKTLQDLGMPSEIVMRHRIPQFNHLFSDDGYAAGYYSYLWSEVLEHDAFQAFLEAGGPYDPKVAHRLQTRIMQVGNTLDPAQAYRNFRGRDASIVPLLKFRGFPVPAGTK